MFRTVLALMWQKEKDVTCFLNDLKIKSQKKMLFGSPSKNKNMIPVSYHTSGLPSLVCGL